MIVDVLQQLGGGFSRSCSESVAPSSLLLMVLAWPVVQTHIAVVVVSKHLADSLSIAFVLERVA